MTTYIVGLFSNRRDAEQAVSLLKERGFEETDISVMMREQHHEEQPVASVAGGDDVVTQGVILGTAGGMGLGFGAGLAASFASLTIPGLGPLLSVGILIPLFTVAGGVIGGVALGGLSKLGISEEDAHVYAEGVKRGGVFISVETDEGRAQQAKNIMQQANALDINTLRERWQREGWSRFDESFEPNEKYPAF